MTLRQSLELTEDSESVQLARAICLRGLMGTYTRIVSYSNEGGVRKHDDFNRPWENLDVDTQSYWLQLANLIHHSTHTPAWEGRLT